MFLRELKITDDDDDAIFYWEVDGREYNISRVRGENEPVSIQFNDELNLKIIEINMRDVLGENGYRIRYLPKSGFEILQISSRSTEYVNPVIVFRSSDTHQTKVSNIPEIKLFVVSSFLRNMGDIRMQNLSKDEWKKIIESIEAIKL